MSTLMKFLFGVVAALAVMILAYVDPALAQEAAAEAAPAAPPPSPINTGDTAWMLTSTALVLLMTIPGLALFYGGMVRKKNVLSIVMQCFAITCIVTIVWMVLGYSLAFTDGGGMQKYLGGMSQFLLKAMTLDSVHSLAGTIPESVFMTYQMTFAIITPALIVGAFADRMKFSAMVLFMILWLILVYAPIAHWVWGGGFLGGAGVLDFAGGTVVHITSGVSALVCALYLGKRTGYPKEPMPPHSLVLSFIGACLLWVGWFGFNAGSALASNGLATSAFVATHFAAATATIGWLAAEWITRGRPSALGAISGAVAGLVAITPASGFVGPMPAMLIGLAAGVGCFLMVIFVKGVFGYDDALDAFGVHGAGGTIGALLTGVFATRAVNPIFKDAQGQPLPVGLLDGHPSQIGYQLVGIAMAWAFALVGTVVLLKVTDLLVGVRATEDQEIEGLDLTEHGEEAYNLEM